MGILQGVSGMMIGVYRIAENGERHVIKERALVVCSVNSTLPLTQGWPPCACPIHQLAGPVGRFE